MLTRLQLSWSTAFLHRLSGLLTREARAKSASVPQGLEDISYHLMIKAITATPGSTAQVFEPILQRATALRPEAWSFLTSEPEGRRVLVDNEHLKVVLIRWEPGHRGAVHDHPLGGGVFLVLEGTVEEERYLTRTIARPYETRQYHRRDMSYIDDSLGLHAVSNPGEVPAVTLHAYLKYR